MSRIIPFELPPIKGGSQGGYTPGPTPTPTVTPYNLSLMQLSTTFGAFRPRESYGEEDVGAKLTITGVTVNDDSQVSSVVIGYTMSAGTAKGWETGESQSPDRDITLDGVSSTADITSLFGSGPISDYVLFTAGVSYPAYDGSPIMYYKITDVTSTFEVTSIKVYDANGGLLQEWEP